MLSGWGDTKIKLLTERCIKCKDTLNEYCAGKKIKDIFADLYLGCMVAFIHCTEPVWTLDRNWSGEV